VIFREARVAAKRVEIGARDVEVDLHPQQTSGHGDRVVGAAIHPVRGDEDRHHIGMIGAKHVHPFERGEVARSLVRLLRRLRLFPQLCEFCLLRRRGKGERADDQDRVQGSHSFSIIADEEGVAPSMN
jgi:hypothetical protein